MATDLTAIVAEMRARIVDSWTANDHEVLAWADRIEAALQDREGWRPIETAPKDGSYILVTNGEPDGCFVVCWYDEGWCYEVHRHDGAVHMNTATHWMPLPAAPTGGSET